MHMLYICMYAKEFPLNVEGIVLEILKYVF